MIGIDTNVLIRIFFEENKIQSQKAKQLIEQHKIVFISTIVLCEASWVLETRYQFTKNELTKFLGSILRNHCFEVEHHEAVWLAFNDYQQTNIDFSDCLIGTIAKINGCSAVATFAKKAAKSKNFIN